MEFYFPYITKKNECRACQDCVNSCPAEALYYDNELILDKEKCRNYQRKIKDVCMQCVQYCRKSLIQLKEET